MIGMTLVVGEEEVVVVAVDDYVLVAGVAVTLPSKEQEHSY